MSLLLSIDPGVSCPGAAVFDLETKTLVSARYFKGGRFNLPQTVATAKTVLDWAASFGSIAAFVAEWPQVYGGGRSGGRKDPNDLLPLAAFNGAMALGASALAIHAGQTSMEVRHYTPHEWKGSKKKNPTARWVLERAGFNERKNIWNLHEFIEEINKAEARGVECKHPTMNALDAIGVGLFHLGRLTRKRVISR